MKTYRVTVVVRVLEFYEVEAKNPDEAKEFYSEGHYLGCDEEGSDNGVIEVKEERK